MTADEPSSPARTTRRYIRSEEFVARRIGDEFILVPIRRRASDVDSIYTTNEVGARIWELLDGTRDNRELRDVIVAEFDVAPEVAEADLAELLSQLEEVGATKLI